MDGIAAMSVLRLGDSAELVPPVQGGHDLLVTSPPYGDNPSTVPYGQYSYLPLQWIDLDDIHEDIDSSYLRSTHEIDTRSLGGSKKHAVRDVQHLSSREPEPHEDPAKARAATHRSGQPCCCFLP